MCLRVRFWGTVFFYKLPIGISKFRQHGAVLRKRDWPLMKSLYSKTSPIGCSLNCTISFYGANLRYMTGRLHEPLLNFPKRDSVKNSLFNSRSTLYTNSICLMEIVVLTFYRLVLLNMPMRIVTIAQNYNLIFLKNFDIFSETEARLL